MVVCEKGAALGLADDGQDPGVAVSIVPAPVWGQLAVAEEVNESACDRLPKMVAYRIRVKLVCWVASVPSAFTVMTTR